MDAGVTIGRLPYRQDRETDRRFRVDRFGGDSHRLPRCSGKGFPKRAHLEERVMYLRTGVSTIRMQKDSASRMLHILESRVDSTSDPYLFNRIRSRQWALKNSSDYKIHNSLLRQIEIYESFGDSVGIACNMVHLCVRYLAVNEDSAALNCAERAERIFNNIGYRQAAFKNVINKAIVFDRLGDTISRNNMVREPASEQQSP